VAKSEHLCYTSEDEVWYVKDTRYEMFISGVRIQIAFYVTLSFSLFYIFMYICCTLYGLLLEKASGL